MTDAYKAASSTRRTFFDPCLEMRPERGSTLARVVNWIEGDPFDDLVLEFKGKYLQAKAAHPGIRVGQPVSLFEWPKRVFWGTCLQPSWYEQPLEDLVKSGRKVQAAMNYIMRGNPKYWPALIRIDKRGEEHDDGVDDGSGTGPDGWNDFDDDGNMDLDEWTNAGHDPADFAGADANGDGLVSREEYDDWLAGENGDEWFQRDGAFPFDPADYRDSWFMVVKHYEISGYIIIPYYKHTVNGALRSNYPFPDDIVTGVTPGILLPFAGITYNNRYLTEDVVAGRRRLFHTGRTDVPCSFEYFVSQGAGGLTFAQDLPDPSIPDYEAQLAAAELTWNTKKDEAQTSASEGAGATAAGSPVVIICDKGRYSAFGLGFSARIEEGGAWLGYDRTFVAYSASQAISI